MLNPTFQTKLTEAVLNKKIILRHQDIDTLSDFFNDIYKEYKRNQTTEGYIQRQLITQPGDKNLQVGLNNIKNIILSQESLMSYLLEKFN
jgi:hypothetical protein